jgi:hypothetical protein
VTLPTTYSLADAAAAVGKSRFWLAEQVRRQRVPHLRIGRQVRFTAEQVAEIVAASEVRPAPAAQAVRGLTARSAAHAQRAGRTST